MDSLSAATLALLELRHFEPLQAMPPILKYTSLIGQDKSRDVNLPEEFSVSRSVKWTQADSLQQPRREVDMFGKNENF